MSLIINVGGWKNRNKLNRPDVKIMDVGEGCDYPHDLTSLQPFKIQANSVDGYYCSMIFEHLFPKEITYVLNQMYLTLKPGGCVRIVVPDMEYAIKMYLSNPTGFFDPRYPYCDSSYPKTAMARLSAWFSSGDKRKIRGHKFGFDVKTLSYFLKECSFSTRTVSFFAGGNLLFKGLDLPRYQSYSIYMEGYKSCR